MLQNATWPTSEANRISVLYTCSNPEVEAAYTVVLTRLGPIAERLGISLNFVAETCFRENLLALIGESEECIHATPSTRAIATVGEHSTPLILFCVDDGLWFDKPDLAQAAAILDSDPSVLCYQFKLHPGCYYSHPADAICAVPTLRRVNSIRPSKSNPMSSTGRLFAGPGPVDAAGTGSAEHGSYMYRPNDTPCSHDWWYPIDLCGSLYRQRDVVTMVRWLMRGSNRGTVPTGNACTSTSASATTVPLSMKVADPLSHPNIFETAMNHAFADLASKSTSTGSNWDTNETGSLCFSSHYEIALPDQPVLAVVTINRVQDVCSNRIYDGAGGNESDMGHGLGDNGGLNDDDDDNSSSSAAAAAPAGDRFDSCCIPDLLSLVTVPCDCFRSDDAHTASSEPHRPSAADTSSSTSSSSAASTATAAASAIESVATASRCCTSRCAHYDDHWYRHQASIGAWTAPHIGAWKIKQGHGNGSSCCCSSTGGQRVAPSHRPQPSSTSPSSALLSLQPLVSILLPVHNCAAYIQGAIDSILSQSYANWQLVLVDDGSNDGSMGIVRGCIADWSARSYASLSMPSAAAVAASLPRQAQPSSPSPPGSSASRLPQEQQRHPRFKLLTLSRNVGIARALNIGLRCCDGDMIARMDGDDVSLPHRLSIQVAFLQSNPDIDVVGGLVETFRDGDNENGDTDGRQRPSDGDGGGDGGSCAATGCGPSTAAAPESTPTSTPASASILASPPPSLAVSQPPAAAAGHNINNNISNRSSNRVPPMPLHPALLRWDAWFGCPIAHPAVMARRGALLGTFPNYHPTQNSSPTGLPLGGAASDGAGQGHGGARPSVVAGAGAGDAVAELFVDVVDVVDINGTGNHDDDGAGTVTVSAATAAVAAAEVYPTSCPHAEDYGLWMRLLHPGTGLQNIYLSGGSGGCGGGAGDGRDTSGKARISDCDTAGVGGAAGVRIANVGRVLLRLRKHGGGGGNGSSSNADTTASTSASSAADVAAAGHLMHRGNVSSRHASVQQLSSLEVVRGAVNRCLARGCTCTCNSGSSSVGDDTTDGCTGSTPACSNVRGCNGGGDGGVTSACPAAARLTPLRSALTPSLPPLSSATSAAAMETDPSPAASSPSPSTTAPRTTTSTSLTCGTLLASVATLPTIAALVHGSGAAAVLEAIGNATGLTASSNHLHALHASGSTAIQSRSTTAATATSTTALLTPAHYHHASLLLLALETEQKAHIDMHYAAECEERSKLMVVHNSCTSIGDQIADGSGGGVRYGHGVTLSSPLRYVTDDVTNRIGELAVACAAAAAVPSTEATRSGPPLPSSSSPSAPSRSASPAGQLMALWLQRRMAATSKLMIGNANTKPAAVPAPSPSPPSHPPATQTSSSTSSASASASSSSSAAADRRAALLAAARARMAAASSTIGATVTAMMTTPAHI